MREKREHAESRFFSAAFGIIIIAVGLGWLLQTIGVLPEGIKILNYVCPICIVLLGMRILTGHSTRGNNAKVMEDTHVKM
jgi:ABC-type multidrug transport system permease subunit